MSVAIIPYDRVINIFSIFCQQYAVAIILRGLYSNAEIVLNGGCIIAFGRTPGWPRDGWASGRVGGVPGPSCAVAIDTFGARAIVQPPVVPPAAAQ